MGQKAQTVTTTAVRSNFIGISRDFATLGGNHG